jgi:hypothetical protein
MLLGAGPVLGFAAACGGGGSSSDAVRGLPPGSGSAAHPVRFVDVTEAAGLAEANMTEPLDRIDRYRCWGVETLCAGAAAADFDGDGWIDLFLTRPLEADLLYRNRGDGSFEEVGARYGLAYPGNSSGAAWGDLDGDGDLDLVVSTIVDAPMRLYVNHGDSFREEGAERGVAVSGRVSGRLACRYNFSISLVDYDNDGDLDIHATQWQRLGESSNRFALLFENDGSGRFRELRQESGLGVDQIGSFTGSWGDIDMDGRTDALIAADWKDSRGYRNLGRGRFEDITQRAGLGSDENAMGATLGDVDGDGDFDWFVSAIYDMNLPCESPRWGCSGNRLYLNDGRGQFTDATSLWGLRDAGWGWGTSFLDYDNDGDLDLAVTNGFNTDDRPKVSPFLFDDVVLWRNEGRPPMRRASAETGFVDPSAQSGRAVVPFDFDNDGDLDVLLTNNPGTPILFRNDGGNAGAWLRVRLRGKNGNTEGLGAVLRLQLSEGGPWLLRQVHGNSTFIGHAPAEAHFGLGAHQGPAHELRIRWPGKRGWFGRQRWQVLRELEVNRVLVVSQP